MAVDPAEAEVVATAVPVGVAEARAVGAVVPLLLPLRLLPLLLLPLLL